MKQIIISLLILACQPMSAQHILNCEANAPQIGDRLKPLHVELPKGSFDEEQHLWDFSHMQSLEANSRQRYVMTGDSAKQRTARIENGQRTYYNIKGDSLLITGRESRLTKVLYDEPELFLRFPMQLGDSVEGYFHGRGTYCNRIALHSYGRYKTKVTEAGSMVLPEGDTLRNVLLVHTERIEGEQYHPDFHHDSLSIFTTDSVMTCLRTDSVLAITHIDRWYAPGFRYPVLERRQEYIEERTENSAEDPAEEPSDIALYNAPYTQQELEDEYNAALRDMLASNSSGTNGGISATHANDSNNGSPIDNVNVSVSGKTVSISFDMTADTTVKALVCNVLGVVYRQESQTGHAGEHYEMQVYCGGLSAGNYVLHLQVNGKTVFSMPCNL